MTFKEWVANEEGSTVEWADQFINDLVNVPKHSGDCTNESHSCSLCTLEILLKEYYEHQKQGNDKSN